MGALRHRIQTPFAYWHGSGSLVLSQARDNALMAASRLGSKTYCQGFPRCVRGWIQERIPVRVYASLASFLRDDGATGQPGCDLVCRPGRRSVVRGCVGNYAHVPMTPEGRRGFLPIPYGCGPVGTSA